MLYREIERKCVVDSETGVGGRRKKSKEILLVEREKRSWDLG